MVYVIQVCWQFVSRISEKLSEIYRVLFQKLIWEISTSSWSYYKKSITTHGHLNVKYFRTVFVVCQVLDFPIETFVCFPVDKHLLLNSNWCYRDTSKLHLIIYHLLYFTITSLCISEFTQYQNSFSFNAIFFFKTFYASFQSMRQTIRGLHSTHNILPLRKAFVCSVKTFEDWLTSKLYVKRQIGQHIAQSTTTEETSRLMQLQEIIVIFINTVRSACSSMPN